MVRVASASEAEGRILGPHRIMSSIRAPILSSLVLGEPQVDSWIRKSFLLHAMPDSRTATNGQKGIDSTSLPSTQLHSVAGCRGSNKGQSWHRGHTRGHQCWVGHTGMIIVA